MAATFRAGLCALLLVAGAQSLRVTPMEKVIVLLKDLSAKVAAEGKKEAAQYDKYACFCKEQADEKLYSIEKSDAKIARLKAEIKELDAAIAELNSQVSDLSKKISSLESEIQTKTDKRNKDHDEYLVKAKDMNEAIDACGAAIEALKSSKQAMTGAKVDFAQVQKATAALRTAVARQPLLAAMPGVVSLLSGAPAFEYQSNDILATIEGLQATFKSMKKDLDFEEHDINSAFESNKLGLSNEKTFAEKEKSEKEATAEEKTETLEAAKSDRDVEQKDRDSDDTFMKQLTNDCEEKAGLFDARSSTRADEISTLAEATAELEKGAVPNFSANKKLAGVELKAVVPHKKVMVTAAFVQISDARPAQVEAIQKALKFVQAAAGRTGSTTLTNVAMRVKMAEDHFVKVRALIKDLVAKLEADAKSEATQKGFCDTGMKKAVSSRDEASAKIEVANAKITTFTATKNDLVDGISTLNGDIAALKKALLEATELRMQDKADNSKTSAMSEEAINSVKLALGLLQKFYNNAALAQTSKYTPPKADRSGNTVGDLAPEAFDSKYRGSQSESKGIVGILEVILSDFERTEKSAQSDEAASKKAFETLEQETQDDTDAKEADIKKKEGELSDAKSNILDQQQDLSDAQELLDSSKSKLEALEAMCVKGEETWEERKQKREDEVEALKSALELLENWQN